MTRKNETYQGFEQGPIRPPSEAESLLIRITRNCPWNYCTFCSVYKGSKFSIRPVEHVKKDIDEVAGAVRLLKKVAGKNNGQYFLKREMLDDIRDELFRFNQVAAQAAIRWFAAGMKSIFIQDANSLIIKPVDLIEILQYLRKCLPDTERITSYARSKTVSKIKDADLKTMHEAGLNRIHIGLESGSDKVLAAIKKGVDKKTHIKGGQKVVKAGMELSEYVMPGMGGKKLSKEHAMETADALNQINPHFIRLRSVTVPKSAPLYQDAVSGNFEKPGDDETAEEIILFLNELNGIESSVKSDHILNLFQEVEGKLPEDKSKMTGVIRRYLELPDETRMIYKVGRRTGILRVLEDLENPVRAEKAESLCRQLGVTPGNADVVIENLMKRFV